MPCHVGPNDAAGVRQVVDHDLIAAGHPRLNFDFHSYFQSLPAHWDRTRDEQRQGPGFHGKSWAAGEKEQQKSLELLADLQPSAPPDFALLDCAACHHALGTGDWRQQDGFSLHLQSKPLPELSAAPGGDRIAWAKELLASAIADSQRRTTYDEAARRYLAVRAVMQDFSQPQLLQARDSIANVRACLDAIGRFLGAECFGRHRTDEPWPTQYELPAAYDPAKFADRVRPLVASLTELETRLADPKRKP
jgi:hypothetical protein